MISTGVNDTAEMIPTVSMTPLKRFQRYQCHAEIYVTPLKSQNDFACPYLLLERISSKNISWVKIPIPDKYFKQNKQIYLGKICQELAI
jgi:hypothetical protein